MTDRTLDERTRLDNLEREVERGRVSRDTSTLLIFVFAAIAVLASVVGVGLGMRAIDESKDNVAAGSTGSGSNVEADLSEFSIDLSAAELVAGGAISVRNNGTMVHNLAVRDTALVSADVEAGESTTLDLGDLDAGTYELYCDIPGHAEAGMTAQLSVAGSGSSGEAAVGDHAGHDTTAEQGAARDQAMLDSVMAFPAETAGHGNQPLAPAVLVDGTKRFELTASIVDWEVRPGETVQAWAYNGMVPGPRINLAVGDRVEVEITNELPIGADIHWHGGGRPQQL